MDCEYQHVPFNAFPRRSQSLRSDRCQNILYKTVFEHFSEIKGIAALLLASKSFQNSSFGANFLVNFVVDKDSILLLESLLSPSSCFSIQFAPSLHINKARLQAETTKFKRLTSNFVTELVKTKYLHLSLRSLTLEADVVSCFFGNCSNNAWPRLQYLGLEACGKDVAVLKIIAQTAHQLRSINFFGNSGITDAGLEIVSKLPNINSINLYRCQNVTDAGLEHISTLSFITSLDLSVFSFWGRDDITDIGLEHISKLSGITFLNLSKCTKITNLALKHLSQLSGITSLNLSECKSITDGGIEHLAKLSGITSLNVSFCDKITDVSLEHVSELSSISCLDLRSCGEITDVGIEFLSTLTSLTSLDLFGCYKISDVGLDHAAKLSNLASLSLSNCNDITDTGFDSIARLPNITSLTLYCCDNITDEGVARLATLAGLTLSLHGCKKISNETIARFPRRRNRNEY